MSTTEIESPVLAPDSSPAHPPRPRSGRPKQDVGRLLLIPLAWSLALLDLLVILWLVMNSFKTTRDIIFAPWRLPDPIQWSNYVDAWQAAAFGEGVLNSLFLVVGSGVGTIFLSAPAAYVLSRFNWKWANSVTIFFATGLGIPAYVIFIPLYVGLERIGLVNSLWGVLVVYIGVNLPFSVFFLTAFFAALPPELEEAAALDGATPFYTFWRIMLPLARSGLLTLFILQAIGDWGETFFALTFLQDKVTISLSLLNFIQTMQYTGARWSVLFAGICIIVLPLIVVYLWTGRRMIDGIASGFGK